jgi:transcriptional regulator with XRE-family HTH domain
MPRPPRFHHPLKTVRKVLGGYSQARFAKQVGCSPANIQAIELGKNKKPSEELLTRAMILTGADPKSLCQKRGRARSVLGGPLTQQSFAAWKLTLSIASRQVVPRYLEVLLPLMTTLFLAGAQKGRAFALGESLRDWMRTNRERFGLEGACDRLLGELQGATGLQWKDLDVPFAEIPTAPAGATEAEAVEFAELKALLDESGATNLSSLGPCGHARGQLLAKLLESLEALMWTTAQYSQHLPARYQRMDMAAPPDCSSYDVKDRLTEFANQANPRPMARVSPSAGSKTKPVPPRG